MRPLSPPQLVLFDDLHPEGSPVPIAQRPITPGCLLPVPENTLVDMRRACAILDVTPETVRLLIRERKLTGFRIGTLARWQIEYNTIVEFCDWLRLRNSIRDRRPKVRPGHRWRDADLLPFPKSDTVTVKAAMTGLNISKKSVLSLIEEGRFEAYQLLPDSPWRISKESLFAYANRLKLAVAKQPIRSGR